MNLIVWARSSCFRNAAGYGFIDPDGYPKEIENLDFVDQACLSATNDDDYETLLNYTILRQVFDMAKEGGDDWVEDRFYKGKKIEQVGQVG